MKTNELDYFLPPEQIAQCSARPRDAARLLVYNSHTGVIQHLIFRDLVKLLRPTDILVFNNTKVFRARLRAMTTNNFPVEIFLLRSTADGWVCLGRPGKRLAVDSEIFFNHQVSGRIKSHVLDGTFLLHFFRNGRKLTKDAVLRFAEQHGEIPLPPYVKRADQKISDYQTVYAKCLGSVAAPTAGFHFTRALLRAIQKRGIQMAALTLHVGLGTFQPIKTVTIEKHKMHSEWMSVGAKAAKQILTARQTGGRVIAVGTTTARALEGWATAGAPTVGWSGEVDLFIRPGYKFKVVRALITNFHLPRSTLLLLVSSLVDQLGAKNARSCGARNNGLRIIRKLYALALHDSYRFYSFGDAMFIE